MADDYRMSSSKQIRRRGQNVLIVTNPDNDSDDNDAAPSKSYPAPSPYHSAHMGPSAGFAGKPSFKSYAPTPLTTNLPPQHYHPSSRSNPALSSPSSTSSPAMESTPPPSTPGMPGPSVDLASDGSFLDSGSLSPPISDAPTPQQGDSPGSRAALGLGLDAAKAPLPVHQRNDSTASRIVPSPTSETPVSSSSQGSRVEKTLVAVTTDAEQLSIVDITGGREPAFIREKIFSKLRISDEDQAQFSIYRTEIGSFAIGDELTDEQLFALCREKGDSIGSLKFFVSHSSAPVHEHSPTVPIPQAHVNTIPPPVLPYQDNVYQPLRPRRTSRSRRGSISSAASERYPPEISAGYDASVSDDFDNAERENRSTVRAPPRQMASSLPTQNAFPSPPLPSSIPEGLRPHSPLGMHSSSRAGDVTPVTPLRIDKHRPLHLQQSSVMSPMGSDSPFDDMTVNTPSDRSGGISHMRTVSDIPLDRDRTPQSSNTSPDLTEGPRSLTPLRREKEPTSTWKRRNGFRKEERRETPRAIDSPDSRNQGEWVVVPRDVPTYAGDSQPSNSSLSVERSVERPMPSPSSSRTLRRDRDHKSPARYHGYGARALAIPNAPKKPPPTPPVAVGESRNNDSSRNEQRNESRLPRAAAQAVPTSWAMAWKASGKAAELPQAQRPIPAQFSLKAAKSMSDLRGGGAMAHPPSLQPGTSSRRPSHLSPRPAGGSVDKMAMIDSLSPVRALPKSNEPPRASPVTRVGVRPLPVHSPLPGTGEFPQQYASRGTLPINGPATNGARYDMLSVGGQDPYVRPQSALDERSNSTPVNRQRRMQSPTWNETTFDGKITRPTHQTTSSASMLQVRPRPAPLTPSGREDELSTFHSLRNAISRPNLNGHGSELNGDSDTVLPLRSPPRSPISPRSPPLEMGQFAAPEPFSLMGSGTVVHNARQGSVDDSRTLKPEEQAWITKMLEGHSPESTIMTAKRKQLPALPGSGTNIITNTGTSTSTGTGSGSGSVGSATLVGTGPTGTMIGVVANGPRPTVIHEDEDDDDDYDGGGTLWLERPKSVAPRGPPLAPLRIESSNDAQRTPLPLSPPAHDFDSDGSGEIPDADPFAKSVDYPRPPPEDVYERLDAFFPQHDLDKPVIEAGSGGTSPTLVEHPTPAATAAQALADKERRTRHKKSIRVVAAEHKKRIDRTSRMEPASTAADMLRKRSTKLWGSKLEEVTSDVGQAIMAAGSPESPSSAAPKPIFKWVRGELIGRGTYGRVYLALNATTGEMIAVKQVEIPRTASDKEDTRQVSVVEALKSESETLKDLDHPHIVQYLGFEETPNFLSIFLEYVPGGSVGSCIRKHGKFNENVTKSFTEQILSGLEYLHSKGILHRDLKADNILVENTGICKISDFGISKRTEDINQGAAFTAMQGTVFWMAPEVVRTNKKGYTFKIDIWSVGCVILEMWAGRRPWSEEEAVAVMFKLYGQEASPPVPTDVELSPLAEDFRMRCFAINPEERPSASELRRHPYLKVPSGWMFNGSFK